MANIFNDLVFNFIVFCIAMVFILVFINPTFTKYRNDYKTRIVNDILCKNIPDVVYRPHEGMSHHEIEKSRIFLRPDKYNSNDLIRGHYKGVPFSMADVWLQELETDGGGKTRAHTIFKGRWLVFDFNKNINGYHLVTEKTKAGIFSRMFTTKPTNSIRHDMDDSEFNEIFDFYTTDESEAYYLLTPTIMGEMKRLETRFGGKINFVLVENKLHIAIYDNKDAFEPPVFKPVNEKVLISIEDDMDIIFQFIDTLKLNRDIFKVS